MYAQIHNVQCQPSLSLGCLKSEAIYKREMFNKTWYDMGCAYTVYLFNVLHTLNTFVLIHIVKYKPLHSRFTPKCSDIMGPIMNTATVERVWYFPNTSLLRAQNQTCVVNVLFSIRPSLLGWELIFHMTRACRLGLSFKWPFIILHWSMYQPAWSHSSSAERLKGAVEGGKKRKTCYYWWVCGKMLNLHRLQPNYNSYWKARN